MHISSNNLRNMRAFRQKCLLTFVALWVLIIFILWKTGVIAIKGKKLHIIKLETHELLWWTSMPDNYDSSRFCGKDFCRFTSDRSLLDEAKVVIFYASDLHLDDLPLPRRPGQLWALLHEESPRNLPYIMHDTVLKYFNYTSTFSRYSNFPLTTHQLRDIKELSSPKYLVPIGQKTLLRSSEKLAPIAFLQSDCDTLSGREGYVKELMKHIQLDSYGGCLHNRDLPESLTKDYLNNLYANELQHFLGRYKFIIAYENGVCDDYITEKFWRPLIVGSIPIYYGSPTIKDWQPNNKSVIYISDFESPQRLAEFIQQLDANDVEYNSYLDHKYDMIKPISNDFLIAKQSYHDENVFGEFECYLCGSLNTRSNNQITRMANSKHYNCPMPPPYPQMTNKPKNYEEWKSIMQVGKCQAIVLDKLLQKNQKFTKEQFDKMTENEYENCLNI